MDHSMQGGPGHRHRFFKGCTRPAMFLGVPLVPFLLTTGIFLLLAMWSLYLISPYVSLILALLYLPVFTIMRLMTKRDDQRLKQALMRARMRFRHANKSQWGSISFSPLRFKKRAR